MSAGDRIEVPRDLFCRECGADCDFVKIAEMTTAVGGSVVTEVRCANGHLQLQFLKPHREAIEYGRKLLAHYSPASAGSTERKA